MIINFENLIIVSLSKELQSLLFNLEQGINDKICSLDYNNYKAEIKTADAQESYKDGVIVLVTGCLTGTDNLRRKFTQSFFLAPQDKGFFVLNDIFRYIEESEPLETKTTVYGVDDNSSVSLTTVPGWIYFYILFNYLNVGLRKISSLDPLFQSPRAYPILQCWTRKLLM